MNKLNKNYFEVKISIEEKKTKKKQIFEIHPDITD